MNGRGIGAVVVLILINIVMFFFQVTAGDWFTEAFVLLQGSLFSEPWRILTSMFLHGSPIHLFFNMYVLFIFGSLVESRIGTKRFLGVYFAAGILAGILGSFLYPAALGASGAVMGVIGMVILLMPNLQVLLFFIIPMSMRTLGILIVLIDLLGLFGFQVFGPNIAHAAHLAGLAVGFGYAKFLLRKKQEYTERFSIPAGKKKRGKKKRDDLELDDEEIDYYIKYGRL